MKRKPDDDAADASQFDSEATEREPDPRDGDENDTVTRLTAERDEWKDRTARALADQENARKRQLRELQDARQYAITNFAGDLIDAVDNMERALAGAGGDERKNDPVVLGVRMVYDLLMKALKKHGVEAVEALGKPFDPNLHNAIAEDETDTVAPGTITAEWQRGYRIGDRLLRPAMVRVACKKRGSNEQKSS